MRVGQKKKHRQMTKTHQIKFTFKTLFLNFERHGLVRVKNNEFSLKAQSVVFHFILYLAKRYQNPILEDGVHRMWVCELKVVMKFKASHLRVFPLDSPLKQLKIHTTYEIVLEVDLILGGDLSFPKSSTAICLGVMFAHLSLRRLLNLIS